MARVDWLREKAGWLLGDAVCLLLMVLLVPLVPLFALFDDLREAHLDQL